MKNILIMKKNRIKKDNEVKRYEQEIQELKKILMITEIQKKKFLI